MKLKQIITENDPDNIQILEKVSAQYSIKFRQIPLTGPNYNEICFELEIPNDADFEKFASDLDLDPSDFDDAD